MASYILRHHLALIALFVALGGTSYAVATGSINSREIKNNTIRSVDVRNGSLRKRDFRAGELPSGPRGAPGAPGTPATRLWVVVNGFTGGADIARGAGATSIERVSANEQQVRFDRDVSQCSVAVTPSYVREAEVAAHTAADTVGLQANEVLVEVAPPVQDLDYHLQVFC